jgi:ParB family chromosome partitioning protein
VAEQRLDFKEPAGRRGFAFAIVPVSKLDVISHQRKASSPHVARVVDSIERVGFVAPVVAVERDGKFVVIDGQHRLLAAQELGLKQLPTVIVPEEIARRMLALNVEKEPNIRERSAVALSIYREMVEMEPKLHEDDTSVADAVVAAHYVTLGFAYAAYGRLAGSSFESILKRCDGFMKEELADCLPVREARSERVVEANKLVKAVSDALKESGHWHEFVGAQIIAYANPLKRTRKPQEFDSVFDKLLDKLRELEEKPEKVLGARG